MRDDALDSEYFKQTIESSHAQQTEHFIWLIELLTSEEDYLEWNATHETKQYQANRSMKNQVRMYHRAIMNLLVS